LAGEKPDAQQTLRNANPQTENSAKGTEKRTAGPLRQLAEKRQFWGGEINTAQNVNGFVHGVKAWGGRPKRRKRGEKNNENGAHLQEVQSPSGRGTGM